MFSTVDDVYAVEEHGGDVAESPPPESFPAIDYGRMLEVLGVEVELMISTAHDAPHDNIVSACPGLTLGKTLRHVGSVYRMLHGWLTSGNRPKDWQREPDEGQSVTDYLRAEFGALHAELAAHEPLDECPSRYPPQQNYAFWARRMMHETIVHRGDVQSAAHSRAGPGEIQQDIAVDGVDEVMSLWFEHRLTHLGLTGNKTASVRLECGQAGWLARMEPGRASVVRGALGSAEMEAEAVVSGEPAHLYLWLWGRLPTQQNFVEVSGEDDAVAQMWALLRLATR